MSGGFGLAGAPTAASAGSASARQDRRAPTRLHRQAERERTPMPRLHLRWPGVCPDGARRAVCWRRPSPDVNAEDLAATKDMIAHGSKCKDCAFAAASRLFFFRRPGRRRPGASARTAPPPPPPGPAPARAAGGSMPRSSRPSPLGAFSAPPACGAGRCPGTSRASRTRRTPRRETGAVLRAGLAAEPAVRHAVRRRAGAWGTCGAWVQDCLAARPVISSYRSSKNSIRSRSELALVPTRHPAPRQYSEMCPYGRQPSSQMGVGRPMGAALP